MTLYWECNPRNATEEECREFSIFHEPSPANVNRLVGRAEPRTYVKEEFITEFVCDVRMESAIGSVTFEIPEVLRGNFDYKAKETEIGWKIVEISLPAYKLVTRQQDNGTWKRSELTDKDDK